MNDRQNVGERGKTECLLWWMGGCGGGWSLQVVYRFAFLISFEVACSVVSVSKQVCLL